MAGIRLVLLGIIALGLTISGSVAASDSASGQSISRISNEDLRAELLRRKQLDQQIRQRLIDVVGSRAASSGVEAAADSDTARITAEVKRIDRENQQWLKILIESRGWPKRSQVGPEAA